MNKKTTIDAFICPKLHVMITEKVDDGATPRATNCAVCGKPSTSRNGDVDQTLKPQWQWYKPDKTQIRNEKINLKRTLPANAKVNVDSLINDHVKAGGLFIRAVPGTDKASDLLGREISILEPSFAEKFTRFISKIKARFAKDTVKGESEAPVIKM